MAENAKGANLYRIKIHFDDGRPAVELLAEESDISLESKGSVSGLRKYGYTMPGGNRASLYLDPGKVAAIIPVPAEQCEEQSRSQTPDPDTPRKSAHSNGRERMPEQESDRPAVGAEQPSPVRPSVETARFWTPPDTEVASSAGVPRSSDLECELLKFLSRFVAAEARQLCNAYAIQKRLFHRGSYSLAAEHFFYSEKQACRQLMTMAREGLIERCKYYYHAGSEFVYQATQKGTDLVKMDSLPSVSPTDNAHGPNYYTKMVDLYQKVMSSLRGEAEWVTGRELLGEKARIARERELGRSLPAAVPGAHKAWPMTPEGALFFKDTGTVVVVGLELTRVSEKRFAAYETILESYSMDPTIHKAYLFFAHEEAMRRVKELSRCYRQDGFFVFKEYKAGDPVELAR